MGVANKGGDAVEGELDGPWHEAPCSEIVPESAKKEYLEIKNLVFEFMAP